ncbi:MAG: diguanylate cyclase [Butyrivibrio sp.]|nr:diguanylate cyclase [Butyrivibrio sp.]
MKLWNNRRYGRILALALLVAAIWLLAESSTQVLTPGDKVISLTSGWNISKNGEQLSTDSLLDANIGVINHQDVIVISRTIEDYGIVTPCVSLYTSHTINDAYIDNKLVYSFGRDYFSRNKTVPKKNNYIPLGYDCVGKELKLIISGTRDGATSGLPSILLGERGTLFSYEIIRMRYNLLIGLFLIALGLILMVLSPYMVIYHHNDLRLFFSGLCSLLLGIYCLSYYGLIELMCNNSLINTISEYSSLYNIPTVLLGYLICVYPGKLKKVFKILFAFNLVVFMSVLLLCLFSVSRISDFTGLLHTMAISEGLLSIFVILYDYIRKVHKTGRHSINSDIVFLIGILLFTFLSVCDIVKYNYEKYIGLRGERYATITGFTFGSLALVASLLISYLLYIIYNSNVDSMQSRIASLAFTDPLTGLANRTRCEQVLDMLTEEHSTYTIISLDLNKLKTVNDTLGHHEGDRLISGFATILSDCFWDANLVGRMGGDEFIVVLTEERALSCTKRIHELYSMINDWNRKEQHFKYSSSYGYAYSYEVPSGSAQEVYMLADSRMYEMKREHQAREEKEVAGNA